MYQLGIAKEFSGEIESAAQLLGDSVPLYRAAGDEVGALWAFAEYAWMVAYFEGLDVALPLYEEGMARAEEVGAEGARYSMVYGLAQYLTLVGRLDEARERVEPLLRRPAPVEHFGQWATLILAMAMAMLGEVDAASPLAEGVLDYGLQASDFMAVAMASWVLALVRLSQGRVGEARVAVETISSTAWAMGPVWMAWLLEGAAAVSIAEGDLPGARTTARQLAASLPEVNIAVGRVVEASLVDVLVELGELDEAKARLVEAVRSTDREVAPAHRAHALIAFARVVAPNRTSGRCRRTSARGARDLPRNGPQARGGRRPRSCSGRAQQNRGVMRRRRACSPPPTRSGTRRGTSIGRPPSRPSTASPKRRPGPPSAPSSTIGGPTVQR